MADIMKLLAEAAGTVPTAQAPQVGVPLPSFEQAYSTAAGMETGKGTLSMSALEADLRNLSPNRLIEKYGEATASRLMGAQQRANAAYQGDLSLRTGRTPSQVAWDSATGVGSGFALGLGSLGALGLGLIDDEAGAWASGKVQQGTQWVEGKQSSGVNAARRVQRAASGLDARDNTLRMEQEIASGDSEFVAGLRRWGRDTVDTLANSVTDPTMLGQGTSEAVGSLLAGGPISKGLRAIGAAAMAGGRASGLLSRTAAAGADDSAAILASLSAAERPLIGAVGTGRIARAGDWAAWPLATAGLEAGGAYSGAVSQIMEMDFPELMETSPTFRELVEGGMDPEQARIEVANKAGLMAAAIQAPFAAATGTLTRFAETPLRVPSLGSGLRNVFVNEPLEEAVQSTTGGLAQNLAVKRYGDENLSVTEGLGEQTAQGALYGFTAAGTVQAPGMALQGTKEAVRSAVRAGKSVARANKDRAREILRAEEAKSEVGSETVIKAAAEVVDSMGTVAPAVTAAVDALDIKDEQKQEVKDYLSKVEAALSFDGPALMEQLGLPQEAANALFPNVTNRVDAVMTAAARLAAAKTDEEVLAWGGTLHNIMEPLQEVAAMDIEAMSELPDSAVEALRTYQNVLNTIEDTDVMREGLAKFREHMASMEQAPITEEEIATPQGQARAQATVAAASIDPLSVNEEAVKTVLDHAKAGRIQLTPENRRALNISLGLLGAVREMEAKASANGLAPKNPISENILTGNDPAYGAQQSANQHLHELRRAIRGGNAALARGVLDVFGEFVQHMGRKVEALNKHLDTFGQKGRPAYIPYVAYNPETGETYMSDSATDSRHKGMFVEPTNAASVRLAQTMALEYETLNKVFNTLVSAMPELRVKPLPMVELNPELTGKVDDVVKKFQLKKAGVSKIEELVPKKAAQPKQEAKATPKKAEPKKVEEAPPKKEAAPVEQAPSVSNKEWMSGTRRDIRPDNGRARMKVGDTTISYDRDDDGIRINLISTPKEARGKGSARRAMNTFLQATDAVGLPVSLSVAEQDATTNRDALVKFYSSFGFVPTKGDGMTRAVGAEATEQVEPVTEIPTEAPEEALPEPEIEEAPGAFVLTEGQVKALEMAREFMADKSQTAFSIVGPAGTGKTTIVNQLLEDLPPGTPVILASPTHRANAVTQSKTGDKYPIKTLHSLLGLQPSMKLEKFDASKPQFEFGKKPDIERGSLIVMDESSMIPDKLFWFLMTQVELANAKIIFLGDGAQLAPVGQKKLSAAIADPSIKRAELTEVKRAKNSALLGESVYVRENGKFTNTPSMQKRNGVAFTNSRDAFLNQAVKLFQSDAFKDNPLLGRVLAFTNKQVRNYNAAIRQALFPEGGELVVGELLMGYNTIGREGEGRASVSNGVDYIVTEVSEKKDIEVFNGVKLPGYTVKLRNVYDGQISTVRMISPSTPRSLINKLSEELAPIANFAWQAGSYEAKVMDDLRERFVFPFDVTYENTKFGTSTAIPKTIDYGYAHTIHKSQGGTYTYALVDNIDIGVARSEDERARLRYVGLTRAERGTYVLTSDTINPPSNAEVVSLVAEAKPAAATEAPAQAAVEAPVETSPTETEQDPAPVPKDIPEFEPTEKNLATRVAKAYPKLVKHVRNMFTQLFDMPKEPQTRIWDYESPAQALYDAVSQGEEGIEDFGVKLRFPISPETLDSFADLLRPNPESRAVAAAVVKRGRAINAKEARTLANVKGVVQVMQHNLRKALNERYYKKGDDERTVADVFASGVEVNRATRFKGLNITEQTENGNFVYNQTLAEAAVLAGFNWALTMGRTVQDRDPEQIAKITGLAEEVQGNAADALKQGFTATEMANALVPIIKRYWNVRDPRNDKQAYADPAYLDGVPTAVAMEVLRAMEQIGLLHRHKAVISDPVLGIDRTFYVFEPVIDDNPLYDYPELIEELVAVKPEVSLYIGDERAPVPDTKLNTEGVPNTKEDKAAIKAANDTPYFFNLENFEMFRHFTETDFMEIFGGGVLTDENKDKFNVMHAMSVRGRNNNVIAGWRSINILGSRLQSYAKDGSLEDVAIRFAHNMSSVSRLQQLGGMTPQGNKLVREIILPTKATVDLTDARKRLLFDLAVAQGLEIKIHKMSPDEATAALNKLLSNELAPAMAAFDTWLKDKSKPLDHKAVAEALRAAGKDVTPLAFHVLKEAARLNQTKDRSAFQTSVYIEADGVTNGVIMAQFLMSIGGFTWEQVRNLMMGGVAFGPAQTMADLHPKNGGEDLYTVAAKKGEQNLIGQLRQIRAQKNRRYVEPHQMAVLDLLQEFLPGVQIVPGDNGSMMVHLDRSFSKNPMTVTLYGSSPNGIANKITSLLLDEVYARATAGTIPKKAMEQLNLLMSGRLTFNKKKGEYYVNNNSSAESINFKDLLSLQLNVEQFRQLQANIQEGIVQPLRAGIEATLGSDMMDSVTRIRKAMQIQSIFYEQMFRKRVNEAIEYRKKNDPSYKQGDHLSRTDLEKIHKELEKIAPWFRTANQTMLINKFSFLRNGYNYGRSLVDGDEGYRPFAQTLTPINSGVAAIPYLNIGLGDGQTIQRAWASGLEIFRRALPVFDGVNLSLNDIDAASEVLNRMVMEAGMTNPHLAVMTTFNTFLSESDNISKVIEGFYSDLQSENTKVSSAARKALEALDFALGNPTESYKEMDAAAYIADFERVSESLKEATLSVEARHRVMKSVSMSIDQFAAVGKPYQSKGEELAADLSPEAVAEELNKRYIAESAELSKLLEAPKDPLPGAVVTDDTVARVYSSEMINELVKNAVLSPLQTETLAAVMPGLSGYTVFAGTPEQINNTLASLGKDTINFIRADGAVRNGIIDIDAKTIYLVNQDPEVLVHELVHAATFDTVLRYYRGEKLSPEATAAIQRLEALLEQFQGMRVTKAMTAEQREAMNNAKLEIDNARNNPQRDEATNKAAALNEFMAWATTNNALAERLGKIKAKPLARLVGAVIDAIKSLLRLPKSDMLSNVVFNTGIVAMENTTLSQLVTSVTMDHATNGAPTRLVELRKRLLRNIVSHLDTLPEGNQLKGVLPFWRPMVMGKMVSKDFQNVFGLSQAEASVLELVVATLATNMELDSTALGQAQVLYQHVLEHLTVESFMDPKAADQEAERFYATQKFNLVTGKTGRMMDKDERSSLMATFLGMGMVSPEFQAIMAKLPPMKTKDSRDGTFDQRLAFEAERALNNLGEIIAGQRSKDVDAALASLAYRVFESESEQRGLIRDSVNSIYKWLDRGNDFIVDSLGKLSDWGAKKGMAMHESGSTAAARAAGAALALAAGAIHKDRAEQQAEVAVSWANKLKFPPTMLRLIGDVVGRTGSNANLYDRIKLLRSSIQALRQHFRTDVPRELINSFTKRPTEAEWTAMTMGLAKTDFAALGTYGTAKEVARLVTSKAQRDRAIASLEQSLQQADPQHFSMYQEKAKQLADYMNGKGVGPNLLTNADAISLLPNMPKRTRWKRPDAAFVEQLDQLITLYAIDGQSKETLDTLARLFKDEAEGMSVVISYMAENRADEMDRVRNSRARYNYLKGYIPFQGDPGKSLRVVDNKDALAMRQLGYTNVGAYKGSQLDSYSSNKSYFYSELPSKAAVAQGIMQNIHRTAGGVDPVTGYRVGPTAGRIVSRAAVANITSRINKDRGGAESLIPVFDQNGRVIAYERAIDPKMLAMLNPTTQLHELLGIWRGRQVEEMLAPKANIETLKVIDKMYHDIVDKDPSRKKEFVNLMDYKSLDPVIQDMVDLFSFDTMEYIKNNLNGELWVRRDMLEDVTGYRQPSVSDFWTGVSRWSPATRQMVRDLTINMFGIKAYERLAKVEQVIQGLAADARTLIVVKSGIVPLLNFMSNIYHLLASGVPITDIVKQMPRMLVELRAYNRGQTRKIQLEVQIRASKNNPAKLARLRAEMRSINDSFKRLSIAPLIEAGEFSTVADVGDTRDDLQLSSGKLGQWLDQSIEKYLPPSLQSAAKIALVSKDTALFQGLQKSVQYGDFLAKAVLYRHLTKRKGMSSKEALGIITDEFVNYDRLPGRVRGGLENFGLAWFWNFKLRMVKVAASTLRNRPLYALLTMQLPTVPGAEMPITETVVSKLAEGTLGYSLGPEMGFSAPTLNPWWNLIN